MKRKIYKQLLKWKENKDRKPLMLLGARQVGKTWIMQHFGKKEYKNVAYINCDDEPRMKQLFELDYNIDRILITIQAITGVRITPAATLIIMDEIQEVPRGLHSLKYFCEKAPEYHIMVAGSLLGVTLGKGESFPVGKVDMLTMYPMDYEEYLDATGNENWIELLHSKDWGPIDIMKPKMTELLRQYYFVGGMPGVVSKFIENTDLQQVRTLQRDILEAYRRDISKHTSAAESTRIREVLDSLPSQLARENKKFIYGAVRKGSRAKDFELAIQWLVDAGIVYKVSRIKEPKMPLKFYEDRDAFKLFLLDCGLLACMTDASADQMLIGDNVFTEFKGAFTEQYVLQQLLALGLKPYYWSNTKTPSEIDFIIQDSQRVIPVEVKAEENVRARSLAQFIKGNPGLKGLRISMKGYVDQEWMENIPIIAIGTYFEK
jgi:predicted AAA+ superfamily ATPase